MSSGNDIPVIIFHEGCPKHLPASVHSAEKYNKRVILLGNEENKHVAKEWLDTSSLDLTEYHEFEKVFVNYSTYSDFFSLICFKRYFLIYETMKKMDFDRVIMAESDLYTAVDYSSIHELDNAYAMVSTVADQEKDYAWSSCCHCSYWTRESLKDFLDFCYDTFKNNRELLLKKWNYQKEHNLAGGVCDMTLAYLWSKDKPEVLNSAKVINGCTIDQNICDTANFEDNEYEYNKLCQIKKYYYRKDESGNTSLYLKKGSEFVKVYAIHCSGRGKEALVRLENGYFSVCVGMYAALLRMKLGALKNKILKH